MLLPKQKPYYSIFFNTDKLESISSIQEITNGINLKINLNFLNLTTFYKQISNKTIPNIPNFLDEILKKDTCKFNILLVGHGSIQKIASFSKEEIFDLFKFFNEKINTKSIIIISCKITEHTHTIKEMNLNFPIFTIGGHNVNTQYQKIPYNDLFKELFNQEIDYTEISRILNPIKNQNCIVSIIHNSKCIYNPNLEKSKNHNGIEATLQIKFLNEILTISPRSGIKKIINKNETTGALITLNKQRTKYYPTLISEERGNQTFFIKKINLNTKNKNHGISTFIEDSFCKIKNRDSRYIFLIDEISGPDDLNNICKINREQKNRITIKNITIISFSIKSHTFLFIKFQLDDNIYETNINTTNKIISYNKLYNKNDYIKSFSLCKKILYQSNSQKPDFIINKILQHTEIETLFKITPNSWIADEIINDIAKLQKIYQKQNNNNDILFYTFIKKIEKIISQAPLEIISYLIFEKPISPEIINLRKIIKKVELQDAIKKIFFNIQDRINKYPIYKNINQIFNNKIQNYIEHIKIIENTELVDQQTYQALRSLDPMEIDEMYIQIKNENDSLDKAILDYMEML